MVVGDQKKYLTCLITLKCKIDQNGMPTNFLDEAAINWCKSICFESILTIEEFQQNNQLKAQYISMTSLLMHTVAHSTKPSFRPKTNNQPLKKFLSLALS